MDPTVIISVLALGIALLLVGLVGKVKAKELEVGTDNKAARIIIGVLGLGLTLLAFYGILAPVIKPAPQPTLTAAPVVPPAAATRTSTQEIITAAPVDTATPGMALFNFQACLDPCTGINAVDTFPEKTTRVYLQWQYQNIPAHAAYKRTVTLGSRVWATYSTYWDDCAYPSASSPVAGVEAHTFSEPAGIASGIWTISVEINGEVLLQKNITVLGNWSAFDPAGNFDHCSGLH
jgi:hypothetical protein